MTLDQPRLNIEEVPEKEQPWVEKALVAPLNRFLGQLAVLVRRVRTSQLNVQVVTHKFTAPTTWTEDEALQTISNVQGDVLGVMVLRIRQLDSSGQPVASVAGNLRWDVRAARNKAANFVRILEVTGVATGQTYQLEALVIGD